MLILGIDPGPEQSGWVSYSPDEHRVWDKGIESSVNLADAIVAGEWDVTFDYLVVEEVQHYGSGMPAGKSVHDTNKIIGRLQQAWQDSGRCADTCHLIARPTIKAQLCGTARAKDKNVRQALIDRFPAVGGGAIPQIGVKSDPGPLYGIPGDGGHKWSALAVAVAWAERHEQEKGE